MNRVSPKGLHRKGKKGPKVCLAVIDLESNKGKLLRSPPQAQNLRWAATFRGCPFLPIL